jgi:spermidine/putrescine transport system permease protein
MRDRLSVGGLVLPGIGWLVLFFLIPLGFIVIVSLGDHDRFGRVLLDSPSLDNYRDALDPVFLRPVWNGLRYAALTTIFCLLIGYPIAYWISRYGGANKTLLLVLVMLPFWTSYLIRTYAWKTILGDNGVVNSILQTIGLTHQPIILLNTDIAVIIGMTYGFVPFAILPLFVSIDRLDDSLVAAARDLYADGRSAFRRVTLPLTMPGIIAAAILTFIPAIGDYVTPDLLGGAQTTTIAKLIQNQFLGARDWPSGAALGFLLMAATIIGSLAVIRTLRREVLG